MARRQVLTLGALGLAGSALGCGGTPVTNGPSSGPDRGHLSLNYRTVRYGDHPSQYAELTRPSGRPRGVVVVVHGGFWKAEYDLSLGRPLAASLVEEGWVAWNLEYRRVGDGGGTPETFDDVAAGTDRLADVAGLDTSVVLTLGHSAGGHLATWAAGRRGAAVPVTGVVSQAGVLDLVQADREGLGDGAVRRLLGHPAGPEDAAYDPAQQVPLDVPVRCVHGTDDVVVPIEQSRAYVDAATAAGADATLTEVDGDHFVVIDPASAAWEQTLRLLGDLA
ncbi:alpha/beta hydrolase family protein [Nocardioides sp. GXQ0305]|uniref:alpha/beta hydrolase family protein n=1 Tax=Nocardioides sp. GXQ0305 TaxID=3423912 RepID=UPI003D7C553E